MRSSQLIYFVFLQQQTQAPDTCKVVVEDATVFVSLAQRQFEQQRGDEEAVCKAPALAAKHVVASQDCAQIYEENFSCISNSSKLLLQLLRYQRSVRGSSDKEPPAGGCGAADMPLPAIIRACLTDWKHSLSAHNSCACPLLFFRRTSSHFKPILRIENYDLVEAVQRCIKFQTK